MANRDVAYMRRLGLKSTSRDIDIRVWQGPFLRQPVEQASQVDKGEGRRRWDHWRVYERTEKHREAHIYYLRHSCNTASTVVRFLG